MFNKTFQFICVLLITILLVLLNYYAINSSLMDSFVEINAPLFEPLFLYVLYFLVTSFVLLFFTGKTHHTWVKYVLSWFMPISLVVIFTTPVISGGISFDRSDIAQLSGQILLALTVAFAVFDTFYLQKRKQLKTSDQSEN